MPTRNCKRPNATTRRMATKLYHQDNWSVADIATGLRVDPDSVYRWLRDDFAAAARVVQSARKLKAS